MFNSCIIPTVNEGSDPLVYVHTDLHGRMRLMIRADNLTVAFGSRSVLSGVSFHISDGEKVGLVSTTSSFASAEVSK